MKITNFYTIRGIFALTLFPLLTLGIYYFFDFAIEYSENEIGPTVVNSIMVYARNFLIGLMSIVYIYSIFAFSQRDDI